jgi:glycosyltransferase involved in cell wall biosynthesis
VELAPVVLFTYNRPWHTEQVIEALKRNELSGLTDLVIYSDGPKDEADWKNVQVVRDYLKTIDGFKSVKIVESEKNKGLADSVITGVTEIINKYGRIIVLEDDLVTVPGFLHYMNQALENYEEEKKVMQISGYMFDVDIKAETDAIFLPFTTSWGWATWKRAWKHFDPLMSGYEKLRKDRALRYKFNLEGAYDYFHMLKAQIKGKVDSWAIRWYLSVFMTGGLVLYPVKTHVKNIGFDGSGMHCGVSPLRQPLIILKSVFNHNIRFADPSIHKEAYREVKLLLSSKDFSKGKFFSVASKFFSYVPKRLRGISKMGDF